MDRLRKDNVDYRLRRLSSSLVICSRCLRSGKVRPVPQLISKVRAPTNLCPECRLAQSPLPANKRPGKLLHFPY